MSLGEKIISLRNEKGINSLQLSKELNVANPIIYRLEKNINKPSYELIIKICNYFNVSADWLLGLKEERN